jgi:hypothetical protein
VRLFLKQHVVGPPEHPDGPNPPHPLPEFLVAEQPAKAAHIFRFGGVAFCGVIEISCADDPGTATSSKTSTILRRTLRKLIGAASSFQSRRLSLPYARVQVF